MDVRHEDYGKVYRAKPINAATKRRMNQLVRSGVALAIMTQGQVGDLDPDLMPVNRIMQRWAASVGMGLPNDECEPVSRPPPLDDSSAIVVDQIVNRSPVRYRRLILPWYKGDGSSTTIAENLGVNRSGLYFEWRCSLFYVRQEIRRSGHKDLTAMLDIFID